MGSPRAAPFIYFFSIGYGFAISALSLTIAIMFDGAITVPTGLLCVVMFSGARRLEICRRKILQFFCDDARNHDNLPIL